MMYALISQNIEAEVRQWVYCTDIICL